MTDLHDRISVSHWNASATLTGEEEAKGTVVILPGLNYRVSLPLLFWNAAALADDHWNVISVDWDSRGLDVRKDPQIGVELAKSGLEVASDFTQGNIDLLLAKSMGSLATAQAIDMGCRVVALTPVFDQRFAHCYPLVSNGVLAIGGTRDRAWDSTIATSRGYRIYEVEGANHSMEVPGKESASVAILRGIVQRVVEFARGS